MSAWLRRVRGAFGMGLTWGLGWGLVGFVIELIQNVVPGWNGALVDIWPAALALPGFFCGVGFSMVLRLTEGRRRFDELSLPRFALWGGLGGLLVGASWTALVAGHVHPAALAIVVGLTTLLSAGSAAGSLALARSGDDRALLDDAGAVADVGLTEGETKELLGS